MRTVGIICEYNPFHWGHQWQLQRTRDHFGADCAIVCLMSGAFVQRGEPAAFPKHLRARAAVLGGADLVLELPLTAAVNAAGYFAKSGVGCLDALGCVEALSFGSECGDLTRLMKTAELLMKDEFEDVLARQLKTGCSYAAARETALKALGGEAGLLKGANNALGVDYIRAILDLGSSMEPFTVSREKEFLSASDIRKGMAEKNWNGDLPFGSLYENQPIYTLEQGEKAMLAVLRSLPDSAFEAMAFDAEGLWSKVKKACRRENSLEFIMMACKSKRYALSRIRRIILCLYLGLGQSEMELEIPYLRVLAFNDRGREVLAGARKTSRLPLITGPIPRTPEARRYFELEQRAADLYTLFASDRPPMPWGEEKAKKPEIISERKEFI